MKRSYSCSQFEIDSRGCKFILHVDKRHLGERNISKKYQSVSRRSATEKAHSKSEINQISKDEFF